MAKGIQNLWGLLSTRNKAPETQTDVSNGTMHNGALSFLASSSGETEDLLSLVQRCGSSADITPKEWAKLTRVMLDKVPMVKRAIKIHSDMIGSPLIPAKAEISDRTREMANAYLQTLPLLIESMPNEPNAISGDTLVRKIVKDCLVEGMAIVEERFRVVGDDISDEYQGAMIFDPKNWSYNHMPESGALSLQYLDLQTPMYRDGIFYPNPYFHAIALETDHGSPWGVPIMRGGIMIFRVFVSLLLCIELQGKRFGNPPTYTMVTGDDPATLNNPKVQTAVSSALKTLKDNIATAWEYTYKGRAADIVSSIPGNNKITTGSLGADLSNWVDPDMLWKIIILALNVLEVPPTLMNINDVGGGMNSDMNATHYKMLKGRAESNRKVIRPHIESMLRNFLLHNGIAPNEVEAVCIAFEGVNLDDDKQAAELEKLEAETTAIVLENYERIKLYLEDKHPEAVEKYARENGLIS